MQNQHLPPGTSEYDLGGSSQGRRILARQRERDEAREAGDAQEPEPELYLPEREEWSSEEKPKIV